MLYFFYFKNDQKVSAIPIWTIIFLCFISSPSHSSKYSHVWGEETRSGIWMPKSYELHHHGFQPIKYPEKCEGRSCVTLHVSCAHTDNNNEEKQFRTSVLVERHPKHPKQPNPFKVPSYSSKTNVWLNGQKSQISLKRSSLFYAFLYSISYFWSMSFNLELFNIIPVKQINFRMESEDQLLKIQAVFDLSKEEEDLKHMKSTCSSPKKEEPEKAIKNIKKPFFSLGSLIQK